MSDKSGAAFPREDYQSDDAPGQRGITKRELFAAMAMQGIGLGASGMGHEHIAAAAVQLADALLAELAKEPL